MIKIENGAWYGSKKDPVKINSGERPEGDPSVRNPRLVPRMMERSTAAHKTRHMGPVVFRETCNRN